MLKEHSTNLHWPLPDWLLIGCAENHLFATALPGGQACWSTHRTWRLHQGGQSCAHHTVHLEGRRYWFWVLWNSISKWCSSEENQQLVVLTYSCAISVVATAFVSPLQNLLTVWGQCFPFLRSRCSGDVCHRLNPAVHLHAEPLAVFLMI